MRGRAAVRKLLKLGRRISGSTRPIVLMYHRIAVLPADPWQLAVTPERFAEQIEILMRRRTVVPMHWLAKELREGRSPRSSAAVTFDDGYADVFQNALPILRKFRCPASVYITTQAVDGTLDFWWDILARIVFETSVLPETLSMDISGKRFVWRSACGCKSTHFHDITDRGNLNAGLHARLKPMTTADRMDALGQVAAWARTDAGPSPIDRAMTSEELHQLAAEDGIEIGAHTVTHPSLPLLDQRQLTREVAESRHRCEAIIGRTVAGFAYPYGDCDRASVEAVKAAHFDYAVTTSQRELGPYANPFRIPRLRVADWSESDFERHVLSHG